MKCNVKALAISIGAVIGAYVMLLGWVSASGWGIGIVDALSSLYIGYKPGFLGGLIGGVYGFIDGAIAGAIIAYIYNKVQ